MTGEHNMLEVEEGSMKQYILQSKWLSEGLCMTLRATFLRHLIYLTWFSAHTRANSTVKSQPIMPYTTHLCLPCKPFQGYIYIKH